MDRVRHVCDVSNVTHQVRVPLQHGRALAHRGAPHAHGAVVAPRGEPAVGEHGESRHPGRVTLRADSAARRLELLMPELQTLAAARDSTTGCKQR